MLLKFLHIIFDIILIVIIIHIYFYGIEKTSKSIGNLGAEVRNKVPECIENIKKGFKEKSYFDIIIDFFKENKNFFAYLGVIFLGLILVLIIYSIITCKFFQFAIN